MCFFISEPSLITSYQRSATRIQLVPSARVSGAMAPPKRGVEPSGCDHRLPRAGTARLLCLFAVTLLDEMSRCCATIISDKLRSSRRYHIAPKYLAGTHVHNDQLQYSERLICLSGIGKRTLSMYPIFLLCSQSHPHPLPRVFLP